MGPPPSTPTYSAPDIPPANILAQHIILSRDRLFFISHAISSGDICEWRLVRVAFESTMSLYSSCLVDGRYLVDFYIAHPSDSQYNAINKQFCFSITVPTTSLAKRLRLILITFDRLLPLKPTLSAIIFFLIGNTST
jgi:hypothetical protein